MLRNTTLIEFAAWVSGFDASTATWYTFPIGHLQGDITQLPQSEPANAPIIDGTMAGAGGGNTMALAFKNLQSPVLFSDPDGFVADRLYVFRLTDKDAVKRVWGRQCGYRLGQPHPLGNNSPFTIQMLPFTAAFGITQEMADEPYITMAAPGSFALADNTGGVMGVSMDAVTGADIYELQWGTATGIYTRRVQSTTPNFTVTTGAGTIFAKARAGRGGTFSETLTAEDSQAVT